MQKYDELRSVLDHAAASFDRAHDGPLADRLLALSRLLPAAPSEKEATAALREAAAHIKDTLSAAGRLGWLTQAFKKPAKKKQRSDTALHLAVRDVQASLVALQAHALVQSSAAGRADGAREVLWVDDHPENNEDEAAEARARYGLAVTQCTSTSDALEHLDEHPDLKTRDPSHFRIVTDLHRDDEGDDAGKNLIEWLRRHGWNTPVLIFCRYSEAGLPLASSNNNVLVATKQGQLYLYFSTMLEARIPPQTAAAAPAKPKGRQKHSPPAPLEGGLEKGPAFEEGAFEGGAPPAELVRPPSRPRQKLEMRGAPLVVDADAVDSGAAGFELALAEGDGDVEWAQVTFSVSRGRAAAAAAQEQRVLPGGRAGRSSRVSLSSLSVPVTAGEYDVDVRYRGEAVGGSPATIKVAHGKLSRASAERSPPDTVSAGDNVTLRISGADSHGNAVQLSAGDVVALASGAERVDGVARADGDNVSVVFSMRKVGKYEVAASLIGGVDVAGSPWKVTVRPGEAEQVDVRGVEVDAKIGAGKSLPDLRVVLRDRFNNEVKGKHALSITGSASESPVPVKFQEPTLNPLTGHLVIKARLPFPLRPRDDQGTAGEVVHVFLSPRDSAGLHPESTPSECPFTAVLEGPAMLEGFPSNEDSGDYSFAFFPVRPGDYSLKLSLNGAAPAAKKHVEEVDTEPDNDDKDTQSDRDCPPTLVLPDAIAAPALDPSLHHVRHPRQHQDPGHRLGPFSRHPMDDLSLHMYHEDAWETDLPVVPSGDWLGDQTAALVDDHEVPAPSTADSLSPLSTASGSASDALCSPTASAQKWYTEYCLQRLEDMKNTGTAQCDAGARRWEANWAASGERCFGACTCRTFCTDHGRPLSYCLSAASPPQQPQQPPQQQQQQQHHSDSPQSAQGTGTPCRHGHSIVIYRGAWVRAKRCSEDPELACATPAPDTCATAAAAATGAAAGALAAPGAAAAAAASGATAEQRATRYTVCTPTGECARRLLLLLAAEWVRTDPEARETVTALEARATRGECLGFCQTQYCCRLHWCPARRRPDGAPSLAGGSRYECDSGPHPLRSARKGRHQVDFPYYCGDPACCAGQWFCRDETHRRKEKRQQAAQQKQQQNDAVAQQPLFVMQQPQPQQQQQMFYVPQATGVPAFPAETLAYLGFESGACSDPVPSAPEAPVAATNALSAADSDVLDRCVRIAGHRDSMQGPDAGAGAGAEEPSHGEVILPHWAQMKPEDAAKSKQRRRAGSASSLAICVKSPSTETIRTVTTTSSGTSTWSAGGPTSALKSVTQGKTEVKKWVLGLMVGVTVCSSGAFIGLLAAHFSKPLN
eukprot:m51a1_g2630 putative C-tail anchored protein (1328) ;mRNA; r:564817-570295